MRTLSTVLLSVDGSGGVPWALEIQSGHSTARLQKYDFWVVLMTLPIVDLGIPTHRPQQKGNKAERKATDRRCSPHSRASLREM